MLKGEFSVKDLLSKIRENYVEIAINEYEGNKHTGRRYIIEKHKVGEYQIPSDILNAQVSFIVPYFDRISIEIEAVSDKSRSLIKVIKDLGLGEIICTSFEEAKTNTRKRNIVIIEDKDIYMTYKLDGILGEFVCWVESEFVENESTYEVVEKWANYIYGRLDEELEKAIANETLSFSKY